MYWFFGTLAVGTILVLVLWLWSAHGERIELSGSARPDGAGKSGHSVWRYEQANWRLEEDRSGPGFVPGPPPTEAGLFEGYCIKVTSVPRTEAR